jgi:RimJ/RimL family protein N-acetyltransferase
VARFYVGRIRDALAGRRSAPPKINLTRQGPKGQTVVLRTPRIDDAGEWRRLRVRDKAVIEPVWVSSEMDWADRHTDTMWIHEYLRSRKALTAGQALHFVIEVDGAFAGQCNFEWIDGFHRTAEVGIWVDSVKGRTGIGYTAAGMLIEHGFTVLGLERISAPVSVNNPAATGLVERLGMQCEGTMRNYMDVGGTRTDHNLWAITADRFRSL